MSFYKKNKKIQYINITKNNNIEMFSMNMIKYSPPIKMTPPPHVLTTMSKDVFVKHLQENTGAILLKFGAEWCGPCKQIEPLVYDLMSKVPDNVVCACLDIDEEENFDLYAFLKSKRMVNGVPVILCYIKGNVSWIPNDVVVGANSADIIKLFNKCAKL
jgi:thiol-disulfide isomerase/thioredoxin